MAEHKQATSGKQYVLILFGLLILLVLVTSYIFVTYSTASEVPISQIVLDIKEGKVSRIDLEDESNRMTVYYQPGPNQVKVTSIKEEGSLARYLLDAGVKSESLPIIFVHQGVTLRDYASIAVILLTILVLANILRWVVPLIKGY